MKIGIIGAMDVEVQTLKGALENRNDTVIANMEFSEGILNEKEVVVVKCGVGKVNAGICTEILASTYHVTHVINTGVAGSLNNDINIGDLVISNDAIYHDVDVTIFNYELGQLPQMPVSYKADETLKKTIITAIGKLYPEVGVFEGRVVSGDQFVGETKKKQWIKENFHGDCAEMEGCAIAQASYLNNLPFVIIRAISDKADGSDVMDYNKFEALSAERCASIVKEVLKEL